MKLTVKIPQKNRKPSSPKKCKAVLIDEPMHEGNTEAKKISKALMKTTEMDIATNSSSINKKKGKYIDAHFVTPRKK